MMKIDVTTSGHYIGDCRKLLKRLPDRCVQTCITSPPYYGLRDYGLKGQIGLERTPELYVAQLVKVFREVHRVLKDDGTLWLNLGDSYAGSGRGGYTGDASGLEGSTEGQDQSRAARKAMFNERTRKQGSRLRINQSAPAGYKPKDLIGLPWMAAFALRADGWFLRADIVWSKPNPLPEPVEDRPTKAHEYIFLLSKQAKYLYNADAVRTPLAAKTLTTFGSEIRRSKGNNARGGVKADNFAHDVRLRRAKVDGDGDPVGANLRSVWTVASHPYDGAHFATFPPRLIEPCVLAGARVGDLVLDPFFGTGTTGEVAEKHERLWIGFDLGYAELAKARTAQRSLPLAGRAP